MSVGCASGRYSSAVPRVALAIAATALLLGAGCYARHGASGADADAGADAGADAAADAGAPRDSGARSPLACPSGDACTLVVTTFTRGAPPPGELIEVVLVDALGSEVHLGAGTMVDGDNGARYGRVSGGPYRVELRGDPGDAEISLRAYAIEPPVTHGGFVIACDRVPANCAPEPCWRGTLCELRPGDWPDDLTLTPIPLP